MIGLFSYSNSLRKLDYLCYEYLTFLKVIYRIYIFNENKILLSNRINHFAIEVKKLLKKIQKYLKLRITFKHKCIWNTWIRDIIYIT